MGCPYQPAHVLSERDGYPTRCKLDTLNLYKLVECCFVLFGQSERERVRTAYFVDAHTAFVTQKTAQRLPANTLDRSR